MTIKDDLIDKVHEFSTDLWSDIPDARVLPTVDDLTFGNSGEHLDVTILYADIAGSTKMVDQLPDTRSAEYYKAFLHCASQLIRRNNGEIQAYDGDRVMAVYVGDDQANNAVKSAFEINGVVDEIINPKFQQVYGNGHRPLKFTIGIDSGTCLAIKVGVRLAGDIAWIGAAANIAAKLNSFDGLEHDFPIRTTSETYAKLSHDLLVNVQGELLWSGPYNNFDPRKHYRTNGILRLL